MKSIVETKGDVMLMDPSTGHIVESVRPAVVSHTAFIDRFLANGTLRVLASDLPDEADHKAFRALLAEVDDTDLAVEAFVSEVSRDAPDEPATPPKKTSGTAKSNTKKSTTKKTEDGPKTEDGSKAE